MREWRKILSMGPKEEDQKYELTRVSVDDKRQKPSLPDPIDMPEVNGNCAHFDINLAEISNKVLK